MNSINNLSSNENEPSLNLLSTIILSRPVVSSVGMGVGLSYSIYNVRRDFYGFFPCFGIGLSYGMTYGGIAQLTSRALVIHSTDTIESPTLKKSCEIYNSVIPRTVPWFVSHQVMKVLCRGNTFPLGSHVAMAVFSEAVKTLA